MNDFLKHPLTLREEIDMSFGPVNIVLGGYQHGGLLSVRLVAAQDDPGKGTLAGEPIVTLSYNPVDPAVMRLLQPGQFFCKTWYDNEPLLAPLLASGLFAEVSRMPNRGGHVYDVVVWTLQGSAMEQYKEALAQQQQEAPDDEDDPPADDAPNAPGKG
jgi:hypothetical protein